MNERTFIKKTKIYFKIVNVHQFFLTSKFHTNYEWFLFIFNFYSTIIAND